MRKSGGIEKLGRLGLIVLQSLSIASTVEASFKNSQTSSGNKIPTARISHATSKELGLDRRVAHIDFLDQFTAFNQKDEGDVSPSESIARIISTSKPKQFQEDGDTSEIPNDYSTWSVNRVIETGDLSAPLYPELQKTVDEVIAETENSYLVFSYPGAQVLVDVSDVFKQLKDSDADVLNRLNVGNLKRPSGYEFLATTEAEIEVYKNTLLKDLQIAARENQSGTQAFDIETRQIVNVEISGDSLPPLKVEFHDYSEFNQFLGERGISSDFAIGTFRVSNLYLVKTVENGVLVAHVFEDNFDMAGGQFTSLLNAILRATVNGSPNFDNYFTNPDRYFVNDPAVPYNYLVIFTTLEVELNPEVSVLHPPR